MALSIRNLPKDIEAQVLRRSRQEHKTKTDVIVEALQLVFSLGPRNQRRKQLRDFFGKLPADQARTFQRATESFSQIDEDLWKK